MVSVMISGVQLTLKIVLLLVIALNLLYQVRHHLIRSHPDSLSHLKLAENGVVKVWKTGCSDWLAAEIESTVIWPWILMLKLKELSPNARSLKLLIAIDAVTSDEFRQISVWANQAMPAEAKN